MSRLFKQIFPYIYIYIYTELAEECRVFGLLS